MIMNSKMLLVGITGCTCAGKTTLTNQLQALLKRAQIVCHFLSQDDFYKRPEQIEPLPEFNHWRYDDPESIDWHSMIGEIDKITNQSISSIDNNNNDRHVLIIEGNQIHLKTELRDTIDVTYFMTLPFEECEKRRSTRTYEPPDVEGYFRGYVWPKYLEHFQIAQENEHSIRLLDGLESREELVHELMVDVMQKYTETWVQLQKEVLDTQMAIDYATAEDCGAISVFIGTTRNNFNKKRVLRLEYESYEPMAIKQMKTICDKARAKWPDLKRIALWHRLGLVPVKEASVLLVVSSPHRQSAQMAEVFIIDELKKSVPIWKKEIYSNSDKNDETCEQGEWKQNAEYQPKTVKNNN